MHWRLARDDEAPEVAKRLRDRFGEAPPRADRGQVLVLDINGRIRGTAVAQYVLHLEPVEVDEDTRGWDVFGRLREYMKKHFVGERVTVTAMDDVNARLHSILGFEKLGTGTISRAQL